MRESEGASMRIDETCLARVQVAREWRGCWTNCRQDKKLARNFLVAACDWWKFESPHPQSKRTELDRRS